MNDLIDIILSIGWVTALFFMIRLNAKHYRRNDN